MNKHTKTTIFTLLSIILVFSIAGCSPRTEQVDDNNLVEEQKEDVASRNDRLEEEKENKETLKQIGPEILETDIDTSDWVEYKSDKYGYSFKLPANYVFLPEGANVLKINYNPEGESFQVGKIIDNSQQKYLLHFSIIKEDIDSFIVQREKDTGLKNSVMKAFSKNDIDYYQYSQQNELSSTPSIVYKNSLIIIFGHQALFDDVVYRTILNTVDIF